jgi:aconitase A
MPYPKVKDPDQPQLDLDMLVPPLPARRASEIPLEKGPNIQALPTLVALPDALEAPVLLKLGDDVSTDEILPAGARVLPYRSNIGRISEFAFEPIDRSYPERAKQTRETGHLIVAGSNYGQGSSREHAALAPRFLGLRAVVARQFARIHRDNLVNFGVLPLVFEDPADYARIEQGDTLVIAGLHSALHDDHSLELENRSRGVTIRVRHGLSPWQIEMILAGGLMPLMRRRLEHAA